MMRKCIMSVAVRDSIIDVLKHLSASTRISVSQIVELVLMDFLGGYKVSHETITKLERTYSEVKRNDN